MFRKMRRQEYQLSTGITESILEKGEYGILSILGDSGYPYGVPLNYCYAESKIYFHCAQEGAKLDYLRKENKVSFCVVGDTKIVSKRFSTAYESVIAFGKAEEVSGHEKHEALMKLISKYSPLHIQEGDKYIDKWTHETVVIKINIESITGKSNPAQG